MNKFKNFVHFQSYRCIVFVKILSLKLNEDLHSLTFSEIYIIQVLTTVRADSIRVLLTRR